MAIQNALNLTATGVITHDGSGTFTGSTLTEGGVLLAGASNSLTDTGVLSKGDLIVGDGTTAPSLLSVGTNDFVLTADSAEATGVKWASVSSSPSAGNWTLIECQTAADDATIDFETTIDSTYDFYVFKLANVKPANDSQQFWIRVGTGATPTYQSSDYKHKNSAGTGVLSDSQIEVLTTPVAGNAANEYGWSGSVWLYQPSSTSVYTKFDWWGGYDDISSGGPQFNYGYGAYKATTAVTAVRFLFGSGNIESGDICLYGIQKT